MPGDDVGSIPRFGSGSDLWTLSCHLAPEALTAVDPNAELSLAVTVQRYV